VTLSDDDGLIKVT